MDMLKRSQTRVDDESDDDVVIHDYHQSRQGDRAQPTAGHKQSVLQGVGLQHHTSSHVDDDDDASSPEPERNGTDEDTEDDEGPRHPFYNYATEKSDVQTDAKLIYQRHRLDTRTESESGGSPFMLAKSLTMPVPGPFDGDLSLGRSPSLSGRNPRINQKLVTANLGQPAMRYSHSREAFPTLQDSAMAHKANLSDLAAAAEESARTPHHPDLPRELKDPLLDHNGVTGARNGARVGTGLDGFINSHDVVVSEVQAICDKIKHILDLRQGYMKVSNQSPGDNPKDAETWKVYPEPPEPVWDEGKQRALKKKEEEDASASSSLHISDSKTLGREGFKFGSTNTVEEQAPSSPTSAKKQRKMGTSIGEDFDFDECHIPGKAPQSLNFELDAGSVYQVSGDDKEPIVSVPTLRDYYMALDQVLDIASDGPSKSFAYRRLQYLEGRYHLYSLLNEYEEVAETKKVPHRDFYNVRKVDTHVHHSACMNQKHLLRFIKSKMKKCPDEMVLDRDGKQLTLSEVFESIELTAYDLSIDTLDMHAHTDSFHRFDKFNLKYNPIGQSRLRDIFLKTDNFINGRYLAEITKEVIADLESSKYQMVEWRISIYGRSMAEWDKLAGWVVDNKLFSHNVRWLIQIPRLFSLYKSMNTMQNFEQLIRNIFQPLFEVTQDPSSHPKLHVFLQRVIGFDCVDDESKPERRFYRKYPKPKDWNTKQNPPYGYWIYFLFANMTSLNAWRKQRGFNTFLLRPHCGEAGDIDHLAAAVLCCHSISHGITLRKVPLLQYIFYLDQIGVAMSPLSNNALFLTYDRNPFISYFKKGLNVSLSTDDPLQFAFTKEPLIEEYSVAAQIYKLSAVDMCELAKHSVDQCGFELQLKQRWLGRYCYLPGVLGNDVRKCNVPDIREAFRHETLRAEHTFIAKCTQDYTHLERCTPNMPDPSDPTTPIGEIYKAFESPQQYFATVADSIAPAQAARLPGSSSTTRLGRTPGGVGGIGGNAMDTLIKGPHPLHQSYPSDVSEHAQMQAGSASYSRAGNAATSPQMSHQATFTLPSRDRANSRSSVLSKTTSHTQSQPLDNVGFATSNSAADYHISGQQPRAFPGIVTQTVKKRRSSVRSSALSDGAGPGYGPGVHGSSEGLGIDHANDVRVDSITDVLTDEPRTTIPQSDRSRGKADSHGSADANETQTR